MTEELSLNDDPDSLMIEETSTLGLQNISDITRCKIDFTHSTGKIFNRSFLNADFWMVCFVGSNQNKRNNFGLVTTFLLPIALCNIIEYNRCRHIM